MLIFCCRSPRSWFSPWKKRETLFIKITLTLFRFVSVPKSYTLWCVSLTLMRTFFVEAHVANMARICLGKARQDISLFLYFSKKEKLTPCSWPVSKDDLNDFSLECLGEEHAALAFEGNECKHCELCSIKVLCRSFSFFQEVQTSVPSLRCMLSWLRDKRRVLPSIWCSHQMEMSSCL